MSKGLSKKPVRYVFDTHAHGDHSYGNSVWTQAGATTMAFRGVVTEMDRWEPARWQAAMTKRDDVRETGEDRCSETAEGYRRRYVCAEGQERARCSFFFWGGGIRRAMDMCGCRRSGCFAPGMRR